MKKVLVLFMALTFAFAMQAQKHTLKVAKATNLAATIDKELGNTAVYPAKDPTGIPIGQCTNSYSFFLSGPHQVMYNKDINTTIFVHRGYQVGGGSSGELTFDFSTDGGDNWTTNVWISPDMQNQPVAGGCRYPSATIYNPDGNTDPAQARIVANGPCLSDATGSWGNIFEIDAPISDNPTGINDWYGTHNADEDFHPYSVEIGADGTVWAVSVDYDGSYKGKVFLNKAVWNGTKMEWTAPFYTFDLPHNTSGGDMLFSEWDVSVDPNDADHIYVSIGTYLEGDGGTEVPRPHVYESTDAGVTFTEMATVDMTSFTNVDFDTLFLVAEVGEPLKPHVTEIDLTVDANGYPHMMCNIISGTADWNYIYTNPYGEFLDGEVRPTRHYVDIFWNGTAWELLYIAPEYTSDPDWGDITIYKHPQIARNAEGTQIFYSWNDSPASEDTTNNMPDWFVHSWATNGNILDGPVNMTEGTSASGIAFYTQFSPVVMEASEGMVELPVVISLIDYSSGTPLDVVTLAYLNDYKVEDLTGGISENNVSKPDVQVYPNPVIDKVGVSKGNKVEVYNVVGELIYEAQADNASITVDMANYSAGTYIFKVYTNEGIVTKKVIRK